MKRALVILLATTALAVAQGDVSSEFQNAPQQPAQNPPQPAPPQPAPPQPAPAQPAGGGAPAKSGAQSGSNAGGSSFLGKDVPFFDPGSNIVTWDGKSWNISNNAIFEARFEKYPQRATGCHTTGNRISGGPSTNHGKAFARQNHAPIHR